MNKYVYLIFICAFCLPAHAVQMKNHQSIIDKCQTCHGNSNPLIKPKKEACLDCHGTLEEVADLTKRTRKHNDANVLPDPHNNVHYGTSLECSACHSEHKTSRIYCDHCHSFNYPKIK